MLNRIRLTNFQRHRQLEVTFNGGLTALRGANEAGKSTLLRSICYALFGVKGLGATLEELVTWGEEARTLRVELELSIDGMTYTLKRGKSGAELNYDGGSVTGQNEVTAFVCRLLKCDAGAATRLVLANQNEIRGALEAGPAKTTELIERLAEFDQIDNLIETMQEQLTLGATASVEQAIAAAEKALDEARGAAVAPDVQMLDSYVEDLAEGAQREAGYAAAAQAALDAATTAFNDGKVAAAERAGIDRDVTRLDTRITEIEVELRGLRQTPPPDNVDVPALRQRIADQGRMDELWKKWEKVAPFIRSCGHASERDGGSFTGTLEELEKAIEEERSAALELARAATSVRVTALAERQKISDGSCTFCGKDVSDLPEVKARNEKLEAEAVRLEALAETHRQDRHMREFEEERLREILSNSKPVFRVLDVVGAEYAKLSDDVLPPFLVWIGPDVSDQEEDVAALQAQIDTADRQQREFERASAKIETLSSERVRLYTEREAAYERRAKGPQAVDIDALRTAVETARDALRPAREAHDQAKAALQRAAQHKVDALAAYERAKASVKAAESDLAKRRKELDALEFNNALLKRVRQCRPMIADQLWNLVLSAVSTYFSEMRGTKSRVRKGAEGFLVDGHVVSPATLSGSTLDALGLAIRVALVRTFLPTAPFLILDEPAAACDDDRTNNFLGFLAGAGFQQVILVTHEDISQAVADNMITL